MNKSDETTKADLHSDTYIEDKDWEAEYVLRGAYHYSLSGFSAWFLETNHQLLTKMVAGAERVLDLGCGDGRLKSYIGPHSTVIGLDVSRTGIALARGSGPRALWVCSRMPYLPFRDRSFDGVVSSLALQYLNLEDWVPMLSEVKRVLAKGGRFAFSHINPHHRLHSEHIRSRKRRGATLRPVLSLEQVIRLLRRSDFNVQKCVGTNLPFRQERLPAPVRYLAFGIARRAGYFLPSKSYHYVVLASPRADARR